MRSVGLLRAKARVGLKNLAYKMRRLSNWSASLRRCDDTRRRRPPGDGLETEIAQLESGKPPKISAPAWLGPVTVRLTHHPPANRQFLEVPMSLGISLKSSRGLGLAPIGALSI